MPCGHHVWLAQLGYQVVHRDLVPLHVDQLREAAGDDLAASRRRWATPRQPDLESGSADAVLLLPLFTWTAGRTGLQALAEARRVLRPPRWCWKPPAPGKCVPGLPGIGLTCAPRPAAAGRGPAWPGPAVPAGLDDLPGTS